MTQIQNNYVKGQKTYPATVHKAQDPMTAWEGEK